MTIRRSMIMTAIRVKALVPAIALVAIAFPARAPAQNATYWVGTAKVSIAPAFPYPDGDIYLGGVFPGPLRKAVGNWPRIETYARAIAISTAEEGSGVVLGEIETQGQFAAYRQGPYGLDDIQREVAAATGLPARRIILGANHTHAGADAMGIWGGAPESYLQLLKERYKQAALEAWANRKPATLAWGATQVSGMLANQSRWQKDLDDELRVLVARDPETDAPLAFMPNWQGHPSIVPGNQLHPDWPGILNQIMETRFPGAFSMTVPGDIGRTQTGQQGNTDQQVGVDKATVYATKLANEIGEMTLHPLTAGAVSSAQVFFNETVTDPLILGLFYGGRDGVSDIYRSREAPWIRDLVTIGSRAFVVRIGDVVLGAAPGEAYPIIRTQLKDWAGASATFFMALAGDQLGYLISPEEDVPFIAADGNDNVAFMVSPSIGDHVMCSLLKGAGALGFGGGALPERCSRWAGESPEV